MLTFFPKVRMRLRLSVTIVDAEKKTKRAHSTQKRTAQNDKAPTQIHMNAATNDYGAAPNTAQHLTQPPSAKVLAR